MWLDDFLKKKLGTREERINWVRGSFKKHYEEKEHFIPIEHRIYGGWLQSLNIKFGNLLENALSYFLALPELGFKVDKDISGRKGILLKLERECERLIDEHINNPLSREEIERGELTARLEELYDAIFTLQNNPYREFREDKGLDINLLVEKDEIWYYIEVKYNDDHDTGKFKDINRKFLKTFAGIVNYRGFQDILSFKPILYYFNPTRRYYPSPYLREGVEVFRGRELFEHFGFPNIYDKVCEDLREAEKRLRKEFEGSRISIFEEVYRLLEEREKGFSNYKLREE